ncbi:uncharacterized protein BDV17DRAFT_249866 [Aspergillus undulatus]|uniref:uncharacterized protein n=1 Tax=Aspergillus undulatus TaxID=1810928 RepID=UPI003CCD6992
MFAPGPEPSKEEIKAGEAQANQTVRMAVTSGVLLYLCMSMSYPSRQIGQLTVAVLSSLRHRLRPQVPVNIHTIRRDVTGETRTW